MITLQHKFCDTFKFGRTGWQDEERTHSEHSVSKLQYVIDTSTLKQVGIFVWHKSGLRVRQPGGRETHYCCFYYCIKLGEFFFTGRWGMTHCNSVEEAHSKPASKRAGWQRKELWYLVKISLVCQEFILSAFLPSRFNLTQSNSEPRFASFSTYVNRNNLHFLLCIFV